MKKLLGLLAIIGAVVAARRFAPQLRARGLEACERMFDGMPDAFPPKRMMANLEAIRAQNERIIELLGEPSQLSSP
ncbi:MAG TPA: hypothetical protein VFF40_14055 [Acidimicrobiia bacterium]|nr:hypothetical protein [Acidimicrobiia bacterium]